MTYGQFREDMLCALYQEQMHNGVDGLISFRELAEAYDIEWREGWLLDLQRNLMNEGYLRGPKNGQNDDMAIGQLLGYGLAYIEKRHGTFDGVPTLIVKPTDDLVVLNDRVDGALTDEASHAAPFDGSRPIDSGLWTGLPKSGVLNGESVKKLTSALSVVSNAIEKAGLSNEEAAQARAYVLAIHALADAPNPPADLIWSIIARANNVAGIASFFVSLVTLFVAGHA